jgi:hypothetical protein
VSSTVVRSIAPAFHHRASDTEISSETSIDARRESDVAPGLFFKGHRVDRFQIIGLTLVFIAAIPVAILLFYVSTIACSLIWFLLRRRTPAPEAETSFGTFVWDGDFWNGKILLPHGTICLSVMDFDHKPRASFLDKLPEIAERLASFEHAARLKVDSITEKHTLDQIVDDVETDFLLGFSGDDGVWGEIVYVGFRNNEVVNWQSVD